MEDRALVLDRRFLERVQQQEFSDIGAGWDHHKLGLTDSDFIGMFESQLKSRL